MNVNLVKKDYVQNTIIDFVDVDVPLPVNPRINQSKINEYDDGIKGHLRNIMLFDNSNEVNKWLYDFMNTTVYPLLIEDTLFKRAYPFSLNFFKKNIETSIGLLKDNVGFIQSKHIDPQHNVLAGIIHTQDALNNGTTFYYPNGFKEGQLDWIETHKSPSNKLSGSIWANMPYSWHGVTEVTSERLVYLITAKWRLMY
jgi:hypothetical protein